MASVEDLIDELFSDEEIKNTLRTSSNNSQNSSQFTKTSIDARRKMHDWDDEDDDVDDNNNRKLKPKAHKLSELSSSHPYDEVQSNIREDCINSNTDNYKIMKTNDDLCDDKIICDQGMTCARNGHCTFDKSTKQKSTENFDSDSECECCEENMTSNSVKEPLNNSNKNDKLTNYNSNINGKISYQPTKTLQTSH